MEHSVVSDPHIHEPKGASEALEGTVLVSNGDGTTKWQQLSILALDFTVEIVPGISLQNYQEPYEIDGSEIGSTTDGKVNLATSFTDCNKNFKELANSVTTLNDNYRIIIQNIETLNEQVETIRKALVDLGVFTNG